MPAARRRLRQLARSLAPPLPSTRPGVLPVAAADARAEPEPLFDEAVIERTFDRQRWERDGYAVFEVRPRVLPVWPHPGFPPVRRGS